MNARAETETSSAEFSGVPIVRVRGSAFERGLQYGEQARERIHRSRDAYARVYAHFATWDWDQVRVEAEAFVRPIGEFRPAYLDEMRGIAQGSGLDFLDILALNLRTEILFAAKARESGAQLPSVGECTTFSDVIDSERVLGQNWDWMPFAADTIVLVEAVPDDGPSWMTVVEAGLLAKFGMNSAGIAIVTNALVTNADSGTPGVPYHVMLRALLDCTTPAQLATVLQAVSRSSSANYMMATADGLALNAETRPGGFDKITWTDPDASDMLLHANHLSETPLPAGVADVGIKSMPDTVFRLQRARMLARAGQSAASRSIDDWKALMGDHAGYPDSLCCHPNPRVDAMDQGLTITSVIFEPAARRVHLSVGTPCSSTWSVRDYSSQTAWG